MNNEEGPRGIHYYPAITKTAHATESRSPAKDSLALYIHIPFCDKRCYFCEFAVVAGKRVTDVLVEDYLRALREEIRAFLHKAGDRKPSIELIQFGGGTPTSLSAQALDELLTFVFDHFDCSGLQEVIVEGFPSSITDDRLAVLERVPKLKLNIGVQSFQTECLESVGREHGAQAESAIVRAVSSKIESVGIDIIFGLPLSSPETVRSDLEKACALGVEHFALYPLWIYEQTALESRVRKGKVEVPGHGAQQEQLRAGMEVLSAHGYARYTAFHYAVKEAARHRYGLWQMYGRDWIGFGMSAMSHVDGRVFFNDREIASYIQKIKAGEPVSTTSCQMSLPEQMNFALLYGLRLKDYATADFASRFGVGVHEVFGPELQRLEQQGLVSCSEDSISLTQDGILGLSAIEESINQRSAGGTP